MPKKYKAIWISDVHLGARRAKSEELVAFLQQVSCKNLFIIGDLFDGWKLRKTFYWNNSYNDLMMQFFKIIKAGTKIVYITGNHDEFLRKFVGSKISFENFTLVNSYIYKTKGKKYLIIHGDQYDLVTQYYKWVAIFGDKLYGFLIVVNKFFNLIRQSIGLSQGKSFSKAVKQKVKQAVGLISNHEKSMIYECRTNGYNGIICGHTHTPAIKKIQNYEYYNSGDWVESLSALVEDYRGKISLVFWDKKTNTFTTKK